MFTKTSARILVLSFLCLSGYAYAETTSGKGIEFNFENFTNEEVTLGATFKNKQGLKTRTVVLKPNGSSKEIFEGCLEEIRTQIPTELVMKGAKVKTVFKPSSRLNCRTMLTSVHKAKDGSYEIGFAYQ